jgi:hypothetical protein
MGAGSGGFCGAEFFVAQRSNGYTDHSKFD